MAAAGFDVIGPPCEGLMTPALTRQALDVAGRHHLKMWINDGRIDQYHGLKPDWQAQVDAVVAEFGPHPALDGYFLVDEPGREQFADLGLVVTRLRQRDPTRVAYVNLLPSYVGADALGTDTYEAHVDAHGGGAAVAAEPSTTTLFEAERRSRYVSLRPLVIRERACRRHPVAAHRPGHAARALSRSHRSGASWQVFNGLAFARAISYSPLTPVQRRTPTTGSSGAASSRAASPPTSWPSREPNAAARAIATQLDGFTSAAVDASGQFGDRLPVRRSPASLAALRPSGCSPLARPRRARQPRPPRRARGPAHRPGRRAGRRGVRRLRRRLASCARPALHAAAGRRAVDPMATDRLTLPTTSR
jgi:hypothetical protein